MQEKGKDLQQFGICHRFFNFIMNSLIGRGLKRIPLDANGEERANLKPNDDDDSDPRVEIHFKKTEELDNWPHVDNLSSLDRSAGKDEKAMMKRNELAADPSGKKEISLRAKPQVQARSQGEEPSGPSKIIIPITNRAGQDEKKKKEGNRIPAAKSTTPARPDASIPMLTGLGLNINEVSEKFIQNTKERMTKTAVNEA